MPTLSPNGNRLRDLVQNGAITMIYTVALQLSVNGPEAFNVIVTHPTSLILHAILILN